MGKLVFCRIKHSQLICKGNLRNLSKGNSREVALTKR